jgi:hypothetical protein
MTVHQRRRAGHDTPPSKDLEALLPARSAGIVARARLRSGFSLIEIVVIIAALQVFLTATVGLLWAAIRIERAAGADLERTLVQDALANQFRADVGQASSAPAKFLESVTGPGCLILRQADDKAVIYRWDGQRLERSAGTTKQILPLGVEQADVEFTHSTDGRRITLWLTETRGQGSALRTERREITAALGGDLR